MMHYSSALKTQAIFKEIVVSSLEPRNITVRMLLILMAAMRTNHPPPDDVHTVNLEPKDPIRKIIRLKKTLAYILKLATRDGEEENVMLFNRWSDHCDKQI